MKDKKWRNGKKKLLINTSKNEKVLAIWNDIDEKHKVFHSYGKDIILRLKSNVNDNSVKEIYVKAEELSVDLINDFNNEKE